MNFFILLKMINIDKIVKKLKKYNETRVIKYLQIKSETKDDNIKSMIGTIIKKKNIKKTNEFIERLKIYDYTFMTAPERLIYINNV